MLNSIQENCKSRDSEQYGRRESRIYEIKWKEEQKGLRIIDTSSKTIAARGLRDEIIKIIKQAKV